MGGRLVTMALWDGFGGVEMEGWTTETDAGSRHTEHARTHARQSREQKQRLGPPQQLSWV
jgi:hypothetical protein